jgi:hypothetical protein
MLTATYEQNQAKQNKRKGREKKNNNSSNSDTTNYNSRNSDEIEHWKHPSMQSIRECRVAKDWENLCCVVLCCVVLCCWLGLGTIDFGTK